MIANLKVGFLGAGKMATALARGFVRAGLVESDAVTASDVSPAARAAFVRDAGGQALETNAAVARLADVLFIAVKPPQVPLVLQEISPHLGRNHLVVSIAAGIPLARLQEALPPGTRVVRVMPNTPAIVGAAASAYALGPHATPADAELVQNLLAALGFACQLPEHLLDAVTGLSGSGPAYVYLVIEALSDGGVAAGLPRDIATRLAAQTVLGAARMVMETAQHPGALKDQVTSPGGTTIEGLHELEKAAVRAAFINAVRAATEKSRKLGSQ
ncbi:MAG: pyrroline-5-carboxylate reductase [Verrucomicrobiae bacterium]|nr:pyrroline-5-carboxylate reductase [Verrucomicrobiae bacterium]